MRRIDTGAIVFDKVDYERWQRENPQNRVLLLEKRVASVEDKLSEIVSLLKQLTD